MLKCRFKDSKSQYQATQWLVSVKVCLYNRKLSFGIGICQILSNTIACVCKDLPIHVHTMVLSGVKGINLFKKLLKGTVAQDF